MLSPIMLLPFVENFIKDNIQSVWQLEALLYIRAGDASVRSHELEALSPEAAENAFRYLVQCGLLASNEV